ncbi:MAG TPA: phosphotransferase [Actinomycetota bacterium]|nr:phosphotransferase [Actinomycetota bacterium]
MSQVEPRGPDSGLRDLDWLLAPEDAARAFTRAGVRADEAQPTYVRLKPGKGAIVGYALRGLERDGKPVSLPAYARTFTDDHIQVVARKWSGSRPVATPLGPGFVLLEGGRTLLFVFPNDTQLRGLRKLDRVVSELEDLLTEEFPVDAGTTTLRPVRYKPERRFIASATVGMHPGANLDWKAFFVRVFSDTRGERLANLSAAVRRAGGSSVVPRPFGAILRGRVFVEEQADGDEYLSAVLDGRGDPSALADALIRLHRCKPAFVEPTGPAALLETLSGALEAAAALDPTVAKAAKEVLEGLTRLLPSAGENHVGLVHGDMALHNVLDSLNGPVIVDLERSRMGDPLQDVGKVVAHLRDEVAQHPEARSRLGEFEERFVEEYMRATGGGPTERLSFFIASALADRAAGSVLRRALDSWWPTRPVELLDLALEVIRGSWSGRPSFFSGRRPMAAGAQWQAFYPKEGTKWAGFLEDPSGNLIYGVYDGATDSFREVRPKDDADLPALGRWIGQGELINYRVGRRATVRVPGRQGEPAAYVKIRPPSKVKALRRYRAVHDLLTGTPGAPRVPPLLDYRPEEGVIVLAEVPGRSLRDFILKSDDRADAAIDVAAGAVSQLHSISGFRLDAPPLNPPMEPAEYAALAARHAPDAASAYRVAAAEVSDAVRQTETTEDRLLHGDLHDGNVLIHHDHPAILDLDLVHRGDPVEDVGNMMGHLFLRTLQRGGSIKEGRRAGQRFLDAYRAAHGAVDNRAVHALGALTLFRLSCIYLFRRTWRKLTPTLIDEAVSWARGTPAGNEEPLDRTATEILASPGPSSSLRHAW